MSSCNIAQLVEGARSDSPKRRHTCFSQLVERFQNMAYGCAYAQLNDVHSAQDAVQEAFLTAYLSLAELKQEAAFPGWFKQILLRTCHRLQKSQPSPALALPAPASAAPDSLAALEQDQALDALRRAIDVLPIHERQALTLFYFAHQPQREIVQFLAVPLPAIKKRIQRAKAHLKEQLLAMAQTEFDQHLPTNNPGFNDDLLAMLAAARPEEVFTSRSGGEAHHLEPAAAQIRRYQQDHLAAELGAESKILRQKIGGDPSRTDAFLVQAYATAAAAVARSGGPKFEPSHLVAAILLHQGQSVEWPVGPERLWLALLPLYLSDNSAP